MTDDMYKMIYDINKIYKELFTGSVLFVGMGDLYFAKQISANKITILEKYQEVIDKNKDTVNSKWNIIKDDAYTWTTSEKYDVILLDIWYSPQSKEVVNNLVNKYSKYLKKGGKVLFLKTIMEN